jgi:hypothetical protein
MGKSGAEDEFTEVNSDPGTPIDRNLAQELVRATEGPRCRRPG